MRLPFYILFGSLFGLFTSVQQVVGWTIKIKALLIDAILNRVHNIVTPELGYAFVSLIPHHTNEVREALYIRCYRKSLHSSRLVEL